MKKKIEKITRKRLTLSDAFTTTERKIIYRLVRDVGMDMRQAIYFLLSTAKGRIDIGE